MSDIAAKRQFAIVVERMLNAAEIHGPFDHEEDARSYAQLHFSRAFYRICEMRPPAK